LPKIKTLLIGAGVMGSYHARVIAQSSETELSGVVDLFEATGRPLADRYNTTWFQELPDLSGYGAVVVAAPTESHFEIAKQVLCESIPLLVEKPLTDSIATTEELIAISKSRDTPIMCGFLERFNPAILTARQLIQDPIHISTTRHSPYAPRIKTGVAWDLLVHDLDLVTQMMQEKKVTDVLGSTGTFHSNSPHNSHDIAECILTFENGAISQSSASRLGHRKIRTMVVTEKDKLTEIDLLRKDVTVYRHVSDQMMEDMSRGYRQQTVIDIPEIVSSQEPLVAQLSHFVDLINGDADAELERSGLIPAHEIVQKIMEQS
jgi:predicted dehydrogenase